MIRHRSDGQVVQSAGQIDGALAGGLSEVAMAELVTAREVWHASGRVTMTPTLVSLIDDPAAVAWDEVFLRWLQRQATTSSW